MTEISDVPLVAAGASKPLDDVPLDDDRAAPVMSASPLKEGESTSIELEYAEEIVLDAQRSMKERLLDREYSVNLRSWYTEAWRLYRSHWPWFVGWAFVTAAPAALAILFPPLVVLVVPLIAGLDAVTRNLTRSTGMLATPRLLDFLAGFRFIIPVLWVALLELGAIAVGLVCLLIPGLYLLVGLSFALQVHLEFRDAGVSAVDALVVSEHVVRKRFLQIAGFYFLNLAMTLVGTATVFGFFILFPLANIATTIAFKHIFGLVDHHQFAIESNRF